MPGRVCELLMLFHLDWLAGRDEASSAVKTMCRIVSALGLDPARASFEDLEQCDVWLHCVTCEVEDPHGIIWARSWRNAVSLFDSSAARWAQAAYTAPSFAPVHA